MLITPDQIRAARALLRMDQEELARRANVSIVTVRRLEAPDGLSKVAPGTVDEIQRALEAAGAEFVERGVRRRGGRQRKSRRGYQAVLAIAARSAALLKDAPPFTEDDLYDENGLSGVIAVDTSAIIAMSQLEPEAGRVYALHGRSRCRLHVRGEPAGGSMVLAGAGRCGRMAAGSS